MQIMITDQPEPGKKGNRLNWSLKESGGCQMSLKGKAFHGCGTNTEKGLSQVAICPGSEDAGLVRKPLTQNPSNSVAPNYLGP